MLSFSDPPAASAPSAGGDVNVIRASVLGKMCNLPDNVAFARYFCSTPLSSCMRGIVICFFRQPVGKDARTPPVFSFEGRRAAAANRVRTWNRFVMLCVIELSRTNCRTATILRSFDRSAH